MFPWVPSHLRGCKPQLERSQLQLVQEPPSALGLAERMAWEQIFLRMGLKPLPPGSFRAVLPRNLLATEVGDRHFEPERDVRGPPSTVGAL